MDDGVEMQAAPSRMIRSILSKKSLDLGNYHDLIPELNRDCTVRLTGLGA
jgi:hypothetical protein